MLVTGYNPPPQPEYPDHYEDDEEEEGDYSSDEEGEVQQDGPYAYIDGTPHLDHEHHRHWDDEYGTGREAASEDEYSDDEVEEVHVNGGNDQNEDEGYGAEEEGSYLEDYEEYGDEGGASEGDEEILEYPPPELTGHPHVEPLLDIEEPGQRQEEGGPPTTAGVSPEALGFEEVVQGTSSSFILKKTKVLIINSS